MIRSQNRAMANTDDGGFWQSLSQHAVKGGFGGGVACGSGFIQKQPVGPVLENAGKGQALLFTGREALRPMIDLLESSRQSRQATGHQGFVDFSG